MEANLFHASDAFTPDHILLDVHNRMIPSPQQSYVEHRFRLPSNAALVAAVLQFTKKTDCVQLYLSLHDPNGFRGHRQCPGPEGARELGIQLSPHHASNGSLAGALPAGEWRAQIDPDRLFEEAEYHLLVYAEYDEPLPVTAAFVYPEPDIVRKKAGWYQGELHAHSNESDARYPVETVVTTALELGLDFLSLTDHFTNSQWNKLAGFIGQPIALIRSCEITAHQGHANLQGISEWIDVYVDRPEWGMTQAAQATHRQGGLFCVNHPFSGYMAWRYFDFDWRQADLLEIYHNLEGCNNQLQLSLWDRLLASGSRIVGVAGSDSHDPFEGNGRLGKSVTWVYADELSERGIIEGLRRGNAYVGIGAQLRFTMRDDVGDTAQMGESLPFRAGHPLTLHLDVCSAESIRIFLVKDGWLLSHHLTLDGKTGEWQSVVLTDIPVQAGYYRIELHQDTTREAHAQYPDIYWRDFSTLRALSNPIWVE